MDYSMAGGSSVSFRGRLVFSDRLEFRKLVDRVLRTDTSEPIRLDLRTLDFIDSAGLGMLLVVREEAEKRHRKVTLTVAPGQVKQLLELSRFQTMFTMES